MFQQEHNGIGDELVGSLQVLYSTMGLSLLRIQKTLYTLVVIVELSLADSCGVAILLYARIRVKMDDHTYNIR